MGGLPTVLTAGSSSSHPPRPIAEVYDEFGISPTGKRYTNYNQNTLSD